MLGLLALMELQASRLRARLGPDGAPVLLLDQDRARWDRLLIRRGLGALDRAAALGGAGRPYALQAAIAACHARARTAQETDWARIAALYDALGQTTPSPVVELNRAVALGMAYGPEVALVAVDGLRHDPAMQTYHLLHSVRGDLLAKLGRGGEARAEFERAAALTRNARERDVLLARRGRLRHRRRRARVAERHPGPAGAPAGPGAAATCSGWPPPAAWSKVARDAPGHRTAPGMPLRGRPAPGRGPSPG